MPSISRIAYTSPEIALLCAQQKWFIRQMSG
jgi:hypothetical protein